MNKIYRRVWSTSRHCWIVASELSSAKGKASGATRGGLLLASLLLASPHISAAETASVEDSTEEVLRNWALQEAFGASIAQPKLGSIGGVIGGVHQQTALTTDSSYADSTVSGNHLVVLGSRSRLSGASSVGYGNMIVSNGNNNTAIGHGVSVTNGGYATGVGAESVASGVGATALGNQATAISENSIAVGSGAKTANSYAGVSRIAIGGDAFAGTSGWTGAIALGGKSVAAYDSIAVGYEAHATASGTVALGRGSVALEANTVSVGSSSQGRRIVNVADGRVSASSSDAVTGRQLFQVANSGLISQSSSSSTLRIGGQNSGTSIDIRSSSNYPRKIVGVADATLSSTSNDAVSGRQLNATNSSVSSVAGTANSALSSANSAKSTADTAYSRSVALAGLISQVSSTGDVRVGAENSGAVLSIRNRSNLARKITGVADGALSASSTEAVTGKQLSMTNDSVAAQSASIVKLDQKLIVHDGLINTNRTDIIKLRSDLDAFDPDLKGVVTFNEDRTLVDLEGASLHGVAAGSLSELSTDAVNGSQLFSTNQRVSAVEEAAKYLTVGYDELSEAAVAGSFGVALGDGAIASPNSDGATAIGSFTSAMAKDSVALGRGANVEVDAENGFALGVGASVDASDAMALGAFSHVEKTASSSAAIGSFSIASESGTVSFGNDSMKRRLVNIERGKGPSDAVNISQLNESLSALGGGAGIDSQGILQAPTYQVQGGTQHTFGDALTVLDGAVTKNATRVAEVEGALRSVFQLEPGVRSGNERRLELAGTNGMVLTNVANGSIAAGSRDAVNGGQLHAVQQQLNSRVDGLEQKIEAKAGARSMVSESSASSSGETSVAANRSSDDAGDNVASSGTSVQPTADVEDARKATVASADAPAQPAVDSHQIDELVQRANEYTDNAIGGIENRLDKMDKRFNRMAAMSSAQSAMAMNTAGLATYNRLGAGVGHADGESALAVGYQRVLNERGSATFSLNGAFTNSGERSVGVGVGIGW